MTVTDVNKNLESEGEGKIERTELRNRRGPRRKGEEKQYGSQKKVRKTGKGDGSYGESGSKQNYLRKQKRKRNVRLLGEINKS